MSNVRPYSWLGCPVPPVFYYSPCGHLVDCSDPCVDLEAIRRDQREADYMRCLSHALRTGFHGRRSSCQQTESVCEAIDAVAADPSENNRMRAVQARWDYEEWLADNAD